MSYKISVKIIDPTKNPQNPPRQSMLSLMSFLANQPARQPTAIDTAKQRMKPNVELVQVMAPARIIKKQATKKHISPATTQGKNLAPYIPIIGPAAKKKTPSAHGYSIKNSWTEP